MKIILISRFERQFAVIGAALCIAAFITGCGQSKPAEEKKSASTVSAPKSPEKPMARPMVSEEEAAMFAPSANPANMSEADKAWSELTKSLNSLSALPQQWQTQTNEPTKEEMGRFQKQMGQAAGEAADKAKDFYTRFAKDEKAELARKQEMQLLQAAVQLGATNRQAQLQTLEDAQLKNPDLTEEQRIEVRMAQLQRRVTARQEEGEKVALAELEKGLRGMQKEFPNRSEFNELLLSAAEEWLTQGETNKGQAIAREIIAGNAEEEVKNAAKELLKDAGGTTK